MKKLTFSKDLFNKLQSEGISPISTQCLVDLENLFNIEDSSFCDSFTRIEKESIELEIIHNYLKYLSVFSGKLNSLNNINKSEIYWHYAIGSWLYSAIQYYKVRECFVRKFLSSIDGDEVEILGVKKPDFEIEFFSAKDFIDYSVCSAEFDSFITTNIFKSLAPASCAVKRYPVEWTPISRNQVKPTAMAIKFESFFGYYGLSKLEKLTLNLLNRLMFLLSGRRLKNTKNSLDQINRYFKLKDKNNLFSSKSLCLEEYLNLVMPKSFLNVKQSIKRPKVSFFTPHIIDSGVRMYVDEQQSFYIADAVECGRKVAMAQHGGLYGTANTYTPQFFREFCCNYFLSWGWKKHGQYIDNAYVLPSPLVNKFSAKRKKSRIKDKIVFVGTRLNSTLFTLQSIPSGKECIEISRMRMNFVNSLSDDLKSKLKYKGYPKKNGDFVDVVQQKYEQSGVIEFYSEDATSYALDARLVVTDHPITTFLLCISSGIPVVGIWNEKHWDSTDQFQELVDEFRENGFVHSSGEDAANWINNNYDRIEKSFSNLEAVKKMSDKYAVVDDSWFFRMSKFVWSINTKK